MTSAPLYGFLPEDCSVEEQVASNPVCVYVCVCVCVCMCECVIVSACTCIYVYVGVYFCVLLSL